MICKHCAGVGTVTSPHGGIALKNGRWVTYSGPVTCWHCQGTGEVKEDKT